MSDKSFDACVASVLNTGTNAQGNAMGKARRPAYSKSMAEAYVIAFLDVFFKSELK